MFLGSTSQVIIEICDVSMVRQPVRVSVSLFQPGTCPNSLHRIDEDSYHITTPNQNTCDNIFGRYSFDWKNTIARGIINEMRYINTCPSDFGICNKFEVSSGTIPSDGNFRLNNRYLTNDRIFNREKVAEGHQTMARNVLESPDDSVDQN